MPGEVVCKQGNQNDEAKFNSWSNKAMHYILSQDRDSDKSNLHFFSAMGKRFKFKVLILHDNIRAPDRLVLTICIQVPDGYPP